MVGVMLFEGREQMGTNLISIMINGDKWTLRRICTFTASQRFGWVSVYNTQAAILLTYIGAHRTDIDNVAFLAMAQ